MYGITVCVCVCVCDTHSLNLVQFIERFKRFRNVFIILLLLLLLLLLLSSTHWAKHVDDTDRSFMCFNGPFQGTLQN